MTQSIKVEPDLKFIRRLHGLGGKSLKKCYQCATCSVVCGRSPDQSPFPRKEMLWAQWGLRDRLLVDPDVWLCYQCSDCSVHCPRGARPAQVLGAARLAAIERYAIPGFLPKALSNPAALPLLVLFAAAIILLLVYLSGSKDTGWGFKVPTPDMTEDGRYPGGYFGNFLRHGPVEIVFIGGNILVFLLAGISMMRFWRDMKKAFGTRESPTFVQCVIAAVKEILKHGAFKDCITHRGRYFSHLLVFYGFFAAMATAGLAVFDLKVLHNPPPLPFFHPIKILGNLSFVAITLGCLMIVVQRLTKKEAVGKGGYSDWFLVLALFTVALTGGLTQVGRHLDLDPPTLSYIFYFIHMTMVFVLLWYAPYSKFAHMFYRTLAMIFANASGRMKEGTSR